MTAPAAADPGGRAIVTVPGTRATRSTPLRASTVLPVDAGLDADDVAGMAGRNGGRDGGERRAAVERHHERLRRAHLRRRDIRGQRQRADDAEQRTDDEPRRAAGC